jgi:hypothetical protein
VRSIATNQAVPAMTRARTPAAMLTRTINRGTTTGTRMEPAKGVTATTVLRREEGGREVIVTMSEPFGDGLMGWVAVVFRGRAAEFQGDAALLLPIGGHRLDGIHLLAIPEGHLDPEGAIG